MNCIYCHTAIDDFRRAWRRMEGWHRPGKAGGSDVVLRQDTGEFACNACITLKQSQRKAGAHENQGTLV